MVRVIIAAAIWAKEASTAAMAVVWTVVVGLGVSLRSSLNLSRWKRAASASRAILLMIFTACSGYLPWRRRGKNTISETPQQVMRYHTMCMGSNSTSAIDHAPRTLGKANSTCTYTWYSGVYLTLQTPQPTTVPDIPQFPR